MAYYCIQSEPRRDKIPEDMRYIFITKEYPKPTPKDGKKKCTKEQNKEYNDMMDRRKRMFDMLDSGHYDVGNAMIELKPFSNELSSYVDRENSYIYKIKPINACKQYESSYSRNEKYFVSSFDVEKRIDTLFELVDDLSGTIYYADLFHYIFDRGRYANEGYREYSVELFEYAKRTYPDKKIYLGDCIRRVLHSYEHDGRYSKEEKIEEYVKLLLDKKLIEYADEYDDNESNIANIIKAYWFNIAIDYIKSIPDDVREIYLRDIKNNEMVLSILRANSDRESVKELMTLLGVNELCVVLTVLRDNDWEETVETKIFKDMNEVRGYVVKQYGVPFENAIKDVEYWHGDGEEWFKIS